MEKLPTGVEGREEKPLVVTGRGSWVGFLGEEGIIWRFFLGAVAPTFLGSVGVQTGEAVCDRHVRPVTGGLQAELEEEEDDEVVEEEEDDEEEMRSLTAARGSMSGGGGGGAALVW